MATMMKNHQWFDENAVDTEFIRAHEDLTPRGRFHAPISSAEVLTKFRERARNLGLRLVCEKGALKRDGGRYMYLADVENMSGSDYALTVGFRQSSDTSMAFTGICGSKVFLCANGCCNALVKPSRMLHTIGNVEDGVIESKIDLVFERFLHDADLIRGQFAAMSATPLTDEILGRFVRAANGTWRGGKFSKNHLLGSANLLRILEELENPTLNSHDDSSVMRLLNAATYVTTHRMAQKNPLQAQMASRYCNNLIMSIIQPGFRPLGDAVDVEDAEVEVED
jgi:hypothetical protein